MATYDTARALTRCTIFSTFLLLISPAVESATGRTPGAFTVSPTGAAQYSVPLWTPPGAGGMRPQLSVSYSHNRDNGILGMGFDVGGFSAITRCVKTIAQDGVRVGITMTGADVFCLDGNRLRLTSGTYGSAGSTYRTELETYARISANGTAGSGPAWFKVERRDGLIYEYGNFSDSRIDFGTDSTVREWALSSFRDRAGNTIEFKYTEDGANGVYRPDEINYATNINASLTTAPYQVKFVYETATRPDPMYGFWPAGGTQNEIKRLQSIDIKYGSPLATKKMYVFTYVSGAGGRSLLDEMKECSASTSDCLTRTDFSWTTSTAGLQAEQNPSLTSPYQLHLADITGDGREDLVYVNSATNGTWRIRKANTTGGFDGESNTNISNPNNTLAQPIRWDADDKVDLLYPNSGTWRILRSNGTTLENPVDTGVSTNVDGEVQPLDINGDGLDDLVRASSSGGAALHVRYNTGAAFGSEQTLWQTFDPTLTWHVAFPLAYQRYRSSQDRADFNGDGKEDFVCWLTQTYSDEWQTIIYTYVARCGASGYDVFQSSDGSTFLGGSYIYGDLNDDGLTDIAWAGSTNFAVVYGGSSTFGSGPADANFYTGNMAVADYDGDGRDDLIAQSTISPYPLYWMRSTGTGLASAASTGFNYPQHTTLYIGHINGDGFYDIVIGAGTAVKYRLHEPTYADLLASAEDGFGVKASFTYAPMTDASVYTKGTGATFPQADMQSTRPLVKQVTATDGSGTSSTYTLTFTYEKARRDHWGRGFLGFEKRNIVDSRNGLKREETYLQTWPHTGLHSSVYLKQSTGTVIQQTINSWAALDYGSGARKFPYIWNSETKNRELSDVHFSTVTTTLPGTNGTSGINAFWGIVTNATTTTLEVGTTGDFGGQSKTEQVTNTLFIDSANWCVRPETTQSINDLTIGSIPSQTRTLERTWDGASCRVTQERVEPGNTSWEVDIDYEFDAFGNIKKETVTGAGMTPRTTQTDWDSSKGQFPEVITNAAGHVTSFDYDYGLGVLTEITDPNSESGTLIKTSWTYDAFGRKEIETLPDGTDTRRVFATCLTSDMRVKYAFDIELRKTTDAVMRTDNVCFDRFDRAVLSHAELADSATASIKALNKVEFDAIGRPSRRDNPAAFGGLGTGYWLFNYDLLNRVTAETLYTAGGSPNRDRGHTYNGLANTTENFRGYSTTQVMAAWGDLARVTDAANGALTYEFDAFSQLTKVTDPLSNVVNQIIYNIRGMKETSSDLDMGTWTYLHNALGELTAVRDAKTTAPAWSTEYLNLDALGRPGKRREAEGDTDYTWGASALANNIGRLASLSGPGYSESFTFDSKARPSGRSITISGDATYAIDYSYQAETGLLDTLTYPQSTSGYRFKLQYEYAYGALTKVKRFDSPFTAYWTLDGITPRGQVLGELLGNGLDTDNTYDPVTGDLTVRRSNAGALQDLAYQWDLNGNLTQRQDQRLSLTEAFSYDSLDRVIGSTLTGVGSNLTVGYDGIGNITSKDGVSFDYVTPQTGCSYYSHSQRHAVRNVGGIKYCYDKNGNMEKRGTATITWTSFNLPSSISSGTPSSQFWYGPDRQRFKQVGNYSGGTETTFYVGSILEKLVTSTRTHYKHRIAAPTGLAALYDRRSDATEDTFYFTKDHLGNVDTVTNASAAVEVRLSYDAFGARRDEADWNGPPPSADWADIANTTRRGYTEHEHLDNLGLIHMNGRVQDPAIGRFLSADPFVPDPLSSQSFNRYSYVDNNPLGFIDPSGFDKDTLLIQIQNNAQMDSRGGSAPPPITMAESFFVRGTNFTTAEAGATGGDQPAYSPHDVGGTASNADAGTPVEDGQKSSVPCHAKVCVPNTEANAGPDRRPAGLNVRYGTSRLPWWARSIPCESRMTCEMTRMEMQFAYGEITDEQLLEHYRVNFEGGSVGLPIPPVVQSAKWAYRAVQAWWAARAATGAAQALPKLQRIHSVETLTTGSARYTYDAIRKMSTDDIVKSLRPGSSNPLTVKPDGRIFEGNTRILVLEERGYGISSLPRVVLGE